MNKKIGFIVCFPFQWYVHKNVFLEFGDSAEIIIDMGAQGKRNDPNLLLDIITLLDKYKVKYKVLNFDDYENSTYLIDFFKECECLVSLWESGCMRIKETSHIKKVCLTYGAGKELTMVRKGRSIYDLILAYGPRDHMLFSLSTKSVPIGIPKFDDYFNDVFDKDLYDSLSIKLDKNKKTILYLPTHSDLSSLDLLKDKLKSLDKKYNIIIKLHYYNSREDPSILNYFKDSKIILFNDDTDLITLFKFADLVVSDNSSVIFDAILVDIPTIVADFWDENYLAEEHKNLRVYKRGIGHALTFDDSIEQTIKREGRIATFKSVEDLELVIDDNLIEDKYLEQRSVLRRELFAHTDGNCANRAKTEIDKLLSGETVSKKGILYHAYIGQENAKSLMYPNNTKLIKENNFLRSLVDNESNLYNKKIYIYIIHEYRNEEYIVKTINSLRYLSKYNIETILFIRNIDYRLINNSDQEIKLIHSFEDLKNFTNQMEENSLSLFVQSGTILNEDILLKQLVIFNQYHNLASLTSTVSIGSIRDRNPNISILYKYLYGDVWEYFSLSIYSFIFIGPLDNTMFNSQYLKIAFINLKENTELFLSSLYLKSYSGSYMHAFLNESLKSTVDYSDVEIAGFIYLRSRHLNNLRILNTRQSFSHKNIYSYLSLPTSADLPIFSKLKNILLTHLLFLVYLAGYFIGKNK